jgi:hypothetical protein
MKMKTAHYNLMKDAIAALPRDQMLAFRACDLGKNKDKFFVWGLFKAAKLHFTATDFLYLYLDDSHIETALKRIAKELDYI